MNKNVKKISIIAVIAIILIIGIAAIVNNSNIAENVVGENNKTVTISVYNKENENIYKENVNTDKQYLIEVLEENKDLDVITEDSQYGK
ncbi:MAG: hypothetical protein IJQ50_03620, partial [Clostridia bacterium]|nr:hypothetical protein [Clostridia bacterium]